MVDSDYLRSMAQGLPENRWTSLGRKQARCVARNFEPAFEV